MLTAASALVPHLLRDTPTATQLAAKVGPAAYCMRKLAWHGAEPACLGLTLRSVFTLLAFLHM
jgi:hypothetical protein